MRHRSIQESSHPGAAVLVFGGAYAFSALFLVTFIG